MKFTTPLPLLAAISVVMSEATGSKHAHHHHHQHSGQHNAAGQQKVTKSRKSEEAMPSNHCCTIAPSNGPVMGDANLKGKTCTGTQA